MIQVLAGSIGLLVAGLPGAALALVLVQARHLRRGRVRREPPQRLLLLVILVEVRLGRSVLAALQSAAAALPEWVDLGRAARLATLAGMTAAVEAAPGDLRRILSQLARAQRSGAPLAETVRGMIEADIDAEKARAVARARALPVRLMVPITLMVLPGLLLVLYAPALIRLLEELAGPLR